MSPADLRAARAQLKLTQAEMGRAMGVTQPYYAALEAGTKGASKMCAQLVRVLLLHPRTAKRLARAAD